MADVDELARRTTTLVTNLARKAMGVATGVALLALVVGGSSYLTGLAGLEGSARSAWAVVGLVLLVVVVGAPLLARWRLASVSRRAEAFVGELRTLMSRDAEAQRLVVETVAVDEPARRDARDLRPVVVDSRQFTRLRQATVRANDLRELPGVLHAVTTFPALLAVALLGVVVFAVLGFVFLVAWII